jgi:hypothetical protein
MQALWRRYLVNSLLSAISLDFASISSGLIAMIDEEHGMGIRAV